MVMSGTIFLTCNKLKVKSRGNGVEKLILNRFRWVACSTRGPMKWICRVTKIILMAHFNPLRECFITYFIYMKPFYRYINFTHINPCIG